MIEMCTEEIRPQKMTFQPKRVDGWIGHAYGQRIKRTDGRFSICTFMPCSLT